MLQKNDFEGLDTGWMAPDGGFYSAEYMCHLFIADEIWKEWYGEPVPVDAEQQLMRKGWVCIRCVTYMEHGFVFDFFGHLTPEQIRAIKPIFEDESDRLIASSRHDLEDEFNR